MTYADDEESASWYVGLEWDDVFLAGNSLGMAVGQPTFETEGEGAGYAWEFFYKFQVTDCLLYTSPSPRDRQKSRMPSSA